MSTIGFKKYSVGKIFFLYLKNIYLEGYERYLKNLSMIGRIVISIWGFLYIVYLSPKLFLKIWKERKEINEHLEKKYLEGVLEKLFNIQKVFPDLSEENANEFSNGLAYGMMALMFENIWPKFQLVSERLIENGWFINNYIKINIQGDLDESIFSDESNIEILRQNIFSIEKLAIQRFPHRIEALKKSFKHHRSKDYISSISVLLPQIDGIFRELTSKELFSKVKKKNPQSWLEEIQQSGKEGLHHLMLSPLKREEYFGANFSEALEHPKIFSRNRILHGEDMEMNDETKSFKVISLLLYIISNVYDAVNEDEDNPRLKDYFDGLEELKNRL
ncbi:hypothetical protein [Algoriphagus sp.]|uniref:hypothetical protein n=1 Tax=Algoriphagus sp. TaxID=1872435 RepID=UPI00271C3192|nr:hypothetical protein [Algoriphagus sp.]MDO8966334.1 hypothetical protein [Algoriphagus sp.]MDP3198239.1 hypothetical protein [Algoriphagus sp.]